MISTTTVATEVEPAKVCLLLRQKPQEEVTSTPYQIPLIADPRTMRRTALVTELKRRGLDSTGHRFVLVARLIKAVVDEGLRQSFDPSLMDDRQPEKWLHIANLAFELACSIESNPVAREDCMKRSNAWIESTIHEMSALTTVARGELYPPHETPLFLALLQFGAALMIQPIVEEEAVRQAEVVSEVVRGSVFLFSMCTGFCAIPDHLTEATALLDQHHEDVVVRGSSKKRVRVAFENCEKPVVVELNQEISVDIGGHQRVKRITHLIKYKLGGDNSRDPTPS